MPNLKQARDIVKQNFPLAKVRKVVETDLMYIFVLDTDLEHEEGFSPFYSVDKTNGTFEDFSIFDADGDVLSKLNSKSEGP